MQLNMIIECLEVEPREVGTTVASVPRVQPKKIGYVR